MSKARLDNGALPRGDVSRAIRLLKEAQGIVDTLKRPDIGARVQEVIDALDEVSSTPT